MTLVVLVAALMFQSAKPASALSPSVRFIDSVSLDPDNVAVVKGWAFTADYPTVGLGIRIILDGIVLAWPTWRVANEFRPDVGAQYPAYGNWHGFEFHVPVALGNHTLTAEALNGTQYTTLSSAVVYNSVGYAGTRFLGGSHPNQPGEQRTRN